MKIKPLEWNKQDFWVANSPAVHLREFVIFYEDGKYWPSWDLNFPATTDLEALKQNAQEVHEKYLMQFFEVD